MPSIHSISTKPESTSSQKQPLAAAGTVSLRSMTPTQKELTHEGKSAYFSARTSDKTSAKPAAKDEIDAQSLISTKSSIGVLAQEPAAWSPPKPIDAMTPAHFGEQVAALAKQTKSARNIMPMIVRGGVIASLGMLLFGHLAPMAIIGVMIGAVFGGYAIAKFMQLRQAKQFAAMGENNPLTLLQKNMPEDASAADKAKLQSIVDFVEKGDVFGNGMLKTFREPYRAITKRLAAASKPPEAQAPADDGGASVKSQMSAAQKEKADYLSSQQQKA